MTLVDLSHPIEDGMVTYPGLPGPRITDHLSWEASHDRYAPGTEFQIGRIDMIANTGTYVDSPAHRYRGGIDLAGLPLSSLADLPGIVVDATGTAIDVADLERARVRGCAVLLRTGWDRHWRTAEYGSADAPYLTRDGAAWLADEGAALVGTDSVNIDSVSDSERPAHTTLLGATIPIVEHLTGLAALPRQGFRFHAVPAPVRGMGTFPVRAYAVL
jgi:arylformamidase